MTSLADDEKRLRQKGRGATKPSVETNKLLSHGAPCRTLYVSQQNMIGRLCERAIMATTACSKDEPFERGQRDDNHEERNKRVT